MIKHELKSIKIIIFSFDYRNIFENNYKGLNEKLNRDRMNPEINELFIFAWSTKKYFKIINNIQTYHLKAPFPKVRIIQDFLMMLLVPFLLVKKKFIPGFIVIRDFPFIWPSLIVKFFFKSKIVFFLGTMPLDLIKARKFEKLKKFYYLISQKFSKAVVDVFLANGMATKNYLMAMGITDGRIQIMVEDIIDRDREFINRSRKGIVRDKYNLHEKKIVLMVGRLASEKGYFRLLDAFNNLDDCFVLVIVGNGELEEEIRKKISSLNLKDRVILAGFVSREEIWNYYQDADVFVLLSYSEGSPTVVREAMYMKVPVIGSPIDPIKEFLGDNGERGFCWDETYGMTDFKDKVYCSIEKNSQQYTERQKRAKEYIDKNVAVDYTINDFLFK